jgi:dihydrofolate reductase
MGRIIVSENITLDGVVEDPSGVEGFARGGWIGRIGDGGRDGAARAVLAEAMDTEAMLMGRRTYEFFAARWPDRDGPLADRLNSKPKFVVSTTLADPGWSNTVVLSGDPVVAVARLKDEIPGDIVVAASIRLVRLLLAHALVDELRLMVYPVVLGSGEQLFADTNLNLKPAEVRPVDDLAYLTYHPLKEKESA